MADGLQHAGDDSPPPCIHCGREAAGPCASCHLLVCGDCSTLTEGGVRVWAICLECDRKKGRTLTRAWWGILFFVGGILLAAAALTVLAGWLLG